MPARIEGSEGSVGTFVTTRVRLIRVLLFEAQAAAQSALIGAARQRAGRPVDMRDTQIAGIAVARRATLATRNVRHFEGLSTPVVNPWG
jgi:toxin FitB